MRVNSRCYNGGRRYFRDVSQIHSYLQGPELYSYAVSVSNPSGSILGPWMSDLAVWILQVSAESCEFDVAMIA